MSTANASKLNGEYFLDLRNIFFNKKILEIFSHKKKIYLLQKYFLVLSVRNFILILENCLRTRTVFLK